MSKITLNDITNVGQVSVINANFDAIEAELQNKVLYRNNPIGEPNSLMNDLDINGKRVFNLPVPSSPSEAARLQDVQEAQIASNTAFTPTGGIGATNVQTAIVELYLETVANNSPISVTGSRASGAALVSLLSALVAKGIILNNTTA